MQKIHTFYNELSSKFSDRTVEPIYSQTIKHFTGKLVMFQNISSLFVFKTSKPRIRNLLQKWSLRSSKGEQTYIKSKGNGTGIEDVVCKNNRFRDESVVHCNTGAKC